MPDLFLPDRYPKSRLLDLYPEVARSLAGSWSLMMENAKETVAWVGIAKAGPDAVAFFLPHGAPEGIGERLNFAKTVMRAIVRFAKEYGRKGEARSLESANRAALLADIAADFRDNGLFAVREKVRSRREGKPDWARTVKAATAFPALNGAPVYCELLSTRFSSDSTNIIARIQEQIVAEIGRRHRWWLEPYFGDRETPRPLPPIWPRQAWPRLLRLAKRELYQARAIRLVDMLLSYLADEGESGVGGVICGVSDFSTVWEAMLRDTLDGVEPEWNGRLPGPVYSGPDGQRYSAGRMEIDIVVRRSSRLCILDAKYYRAIPSGFVPGVGDISKQIIYQRAVESTVEAKGLPIANVFVFPSQVTCRSPFEQITMELPAGGVAATLPKILCQYVSVADVIAGYAERRKLSSQTWLDDLDVA